MTFQEKTDKKKPPWRPRKIEAPEQLWIHFEKFTQHVERNPIIVTKVFHARDGRIVSTDFHKHRPMTIESFCTFLGVAARTWRHWRANREDLATVIAMIEDAISDQLFCLAAANLINANLISRKLGLFMR